MDEIAVLKELGASIAIPGDRARESARSALRGRYDTNVVIRKVPALRPLRRGPPPKAVAAVVLLALVMTAGLFVGLPNGSKTPAYAATPPAVVPIDAPGTSSSQLLLDLAMVTEEQSAEPQGRFDYVLRSSWYLHTAVADGSTQSKIVPTVTEQWRGANGSIVAYEAEGNPIEPGPPTEAYAEKAVEALPSAGGERREYQYSGEHLLSDDLLPSEALELRRTLLANNNLGKPDAIELLTEFTDRVSDERMRPELRAAFYRIFAEEEDMRSYGTVTDRMGRQGVAVGLDTDSSGLPTRHAIILDPQTGDVLGYEQILTTDAGNLNVRVPAVIGYELIVAAGEVDGLDDRVPPYGQ